MAELDILVTTAPVVTAPAAVWLEAIGISGFEPSGPGPGETYDPSFHEITYVWKVEGAPLAPYAAPQNMVAGWNDPNVTYGKKAAFCFPKPGTYTINLWAVDTSGTKGTARATIVVTDADSLYPDTRTIAFAGGGDFTGAPPRCQQVSTLAALQAAIHAASAPSRVLFKRGETVLNVSLSSSTRSGGRIDHIGAWGTGPAPVLRPKEFDTGNMITWRSSGPETQITVENVKVHGYWDPDTETGTRGGGTPFHWRAKTTSAKILLYKVELTGCEAEQLSCNKAPGDVMVADCTITNWQNYGLFCDRNQAGKYAFVGCRITQSPNALNGGPKKGMANNHGPIRITRCRWIVMDLCDLFSNAGWSGSYDTQPCLRIGTHRTENTQISCHVGRSVMENGYQIINLEGENTSAEDNPGNFVFDRLLLIGTARGRRTMVSCHKGGATFRNMLMFQPNTPAYVSAPHQFFDFTANLPKNRNDSEPVRVHNVTAISLLSGAHENDGPMSLIGSTGSFFNVTVENNVHHVPNSSRPALDSAPIDTSNAVSGVTPRYKGVQYNYDSIDGTFRSHVPRNGGTLIIPYSSVLKLDRNGNGQEGATNQAYWRAIEATDTQHRISIGGDIYHAANGDFLVTFSTSGVTITNVSGTSWNTGQSYSLMLDRKSRLDADLPLQAQFSNPEGVPAGTPLAGSSVAGGAGLGLCSHYDFYGIERPDPASQGAIEP